MDEHGLQLVWSQSSLLARPLTRLPRREAGVEDEADTLATRPGLDVDPHPDVAGPLHGGRGGEVDLLQDLQHPPLLLHLHIINIEQPRIIAY